MEWIQVPQDMTLWRPNMDTVMKLHVPFKSDIFLIRRATINLRETSSYEVTRLFFTYTVNV